MSAAGESVMAGLRAQAQGKAGELSWCCDPLVAGFVLLCFYKWLCFANAFSHFCGAREYQD